MLSSPTIAIIGLTLADAVFVVSEICWDLLVRDDCSEEAREEPPFIEMASYLSIIITCESWVPRRPAFGRADQFSSPRRTGCFLVEIPLAFFAFGIKYYKHFLHLFDAVVVIVTFVLEVALHVSFSRDFSSFSDCGASSSLLQRSPSRRRSITKRPSRGRLCG